MAFTVAECKESLKLWREAEKAIATGQSYSMDNRRLERANLAQVREQIIFWQKELAKAEVTASGRSQRRVMRIVPRDL